MVDFNKHIAIGNPVVIANGIAQGIARAAEKHDNMLALLEDLGYPGIGWFRVLPRNMIICSPF